MLVNPLDDVSMGRVVNVPPRGLGKVSLEKLRRAAFAEGMSLREAVGEKSLHGVLGKKAQKGLAELAETLDKAQAASEHGAHAALKVILDGTHYVRHATGFGDAEDSTREENIAELVSDTVQFDAAPDVEQDVEQEDGEAANGLAGYLQHVALLTSADRDGDGPSVRMMTVHAAKGLEFDHVFVCGLEEGRVSEYAHGRRSRRPRRRTPADVRRADARAADPDAEFGQGTARQRQHGVDAAEPLPARTAAGPAGELRAVVASL